MAPNPVRFLGLSTAFLICTLTQAGYAQGYYFGLLHEPSGPVTLSPYGEESILVEGLRSSPEAGRLQISSAPAPLIQLDSGMSVSLWSLYWGEGVNLLLGAGLIGPESSDPVYLLQIGPGPSPDVTALSVVRWEPAVGYQHQPLGVLGNADALTYAMYIYLSPAELIGQLPADGALVPRTRMAIGNPGLFGLSAGQLCQVSDPPRSERQYRG